MARTLCLAAAQTGPVHEPGSAAIVDSAVALIDRASGQGAELLVFPELFLAPFFACGLDAGYDKYFMALDDPLLDRLRGHAAARRLALVLPVAERAARGYFNSAQVLNERGESLGVYRKTHIPAYFPNEQPGGTGSYEKFYFAPGQALPVFELCGTRIGIQICNDRLYPEASRALALRGAQVLVMPIAFSTYSDAARRASIWEVPLRARAYENGAYVLASNRAGTEGPRHHLGHSMVVDPYGMIAARAGERDDELVMHKADLDEIGRARAAFPWWRDRRPDLYGDLVK
ncbi:carbon-nitrogen hydrolase family protein [Bordetella petrii]|uniref:carbon-nitrogen hydrolase family protein n=1 Tax=Bordetella petrii TaxID=94624 RepID=UPI001E63831E|nr:carbon-nitrogen hydrolase family protein [Bordetella petrii]MCD0501442.1 carbon-nitrogen hydrolase family protein [Bordetella petrii]